MHFAAGFTGTLDYTTVLWSFRYFLKLNLRYFLGYHVIVNNVVSYIGL